MEQRAYNRDRGAAPLVKRSGCEASGGNCQDAKPPEAKSFQTFVWLKEGRKRCCQHATVN